MPRSSVYVIATLLKRWPLLIISGQLHQTGLESALVLGSAFTSGSAEAESEWRTPPVGLRPTANFWLIMFAAWSIRNISVQAVRQAS